MKLLQLCKKFPFPLKEGEAIAVYHLSRGLVEQGCTVDLLTMNTLKHFYADTHWPKEFSHYNSVQAIEVDNRLSVGGALRNLFSRASYHISRFVTPEFSSALSKLLEQNEYDAILLETLYLAPYIPLIRTKSKALVVMRSHNVEFAIWERVSSHTRPTLKRKYLEYLTHKLKRFEVEQLQAYDLLTPVSAYDLQVFKALGYKGFHHVAPIGLDLDAYPLRPLEKNTPLRLGFIGSLDWLPNQEGLQWFLQKVWPLLHTRFPTLQLDIAGRNAPADFLSEKIPGVNFLGEVPNAVDFVTEHAIALAPLRSGSGLKVKVLEAMALGRVVLGTSIALEGIPAQDGRHSLLANTPEDFVRQVNGLQENPQLAVQLGQVARELIQAEFDYRDVARKLMASIQSIHD